MFKKILVSNRGEIALRIMRTLKKMNIKSVAVYSEADKNALHVQYADEAYFIGPSPPTSSYLSIDNIVKVAKLSNSEAIHPGYGFLSENTKFAQKLQRENIKLIGPSASAMKKMGDKIEAKKIANKAGVQTIPGYVGQIKDVKEAIKIAKKIGFPVMIKAAAGGGGKGIRIINNIDEIAAGFDESRMDATNYYLDDRVFIEKLIHNKPRHIEIQILADQYGNCICLGERECSIQRSHQKIIEEAPSTFLNEKTRQKMYKQSKLLVEEVGYFSAGTIEYMVDADFNFYFLEMNTRLQVEHTVTELATGIDIVEQMIKIANGQKLSIKQSDVKMNAWAIESRICAEDPEKGFLPSSGKITQYQEPTKIGVRVDSGVFTGSEISIYYDSMMAKLCTYAETRKEAIELMKDALGSFVIDGITNNIRFLESLITNEKFIEGKINTNFIQEEYPDGFGNNNKLDEDLESIFLASALYVFLEEQKIYFSAEDRLNSKQEHKLLTRWIISLNGLYFPVLIRKISNGYHIRHGDSRIDIQSSWEINSGVLTCDINGITVNVKITNQDNGYILTHSGIRVEAHVMSPKAAELSSIMKYKSIESNTEKKLISPISGQVLSISCKEGDEVNQNQELISIVAMKMQNKIKASQKAKIKTIHVKEEQIVTAETLLIEFE